jgi:hypothetical protein
MTWWWKAAGAAVLGACLGTSGVRAAEDDLSVVKRAVDNERPRSEAPAPPAKAHPQWLKVRILDRKHENKGRVSINLPLSLARALPDDIALEGHCRHAACGHLRLSEILASLEAGQKLVEIEDEDATVRVWVE